MSDFLVSKPAKRTSNVETRDVVTTNNNHNSKRENYDNRHSIAQPPRRRLSDQGAVVWRRFAAAAAAGPGGSLAADCDADCVAECAADGCADYAAAVAAAVDVAFYLAFASDAGVAATCAAAVGGSALASAPSERSLPPAVCVSVRTRAYHFLCLFPQLASNLAAPAAPSTNVRRYSPHSPIASAPHSQSRTAPDCPTCRTDRPRRTGDRSPGRRSTPDGRRCDARASPSRTPESLCCRRSICRCRKAWNDKVMFEC